MIDLAYEVIRILNECYCLEIFDQQGNSNNNNNNDNNNNNKKKNNNNFLKISNFIGIFFKIKDNY